MPTSSKYTAKTVNQFGNVDYSAEENAIWRDLYAVQHPYVRKHACRDYLRGFELLELSSDRVPTCSEVSECLMDLTGWRVQPVPALINFKDFFSLLSQRIFPAASFIRTRDDFDYVEEPDIFHEIFGHAPLLADRRYADFLHAVGQAGVRAEAEDYTWLARLNWFTIEFGLTREDGQRKAMGAGLASSPSEIVYATQDHEAELKPFDLIEVLRTPYRIDIAQVIYFVLDDTEQLIETAERDLLADIETARTLGLREQRYPDKEVSPTAA